MQRLIYISLFFISVIAFLFFYKITGPDKLAVKDVSTNDNSEEIIRVFQGVYKIYFKFGNQKILDNVLIVNERGAEFSLSSLTKNNQKAIFFHFSETNCDECVKAELVKIGKLKNAFNDSGIKIFVLTRYSNARDLKIFKKVNNVNYEVLNIKGEQLLKELNMPFYFILDSDYLYKDIFIPVKEFPDLTIDYIDLMRKKHLRKV